MEEYKAVQADMQHKKKKNGLVAALIIVIILAIAAIGGTWYYMNNKAKNDKKAQEEQIQQLQKQIDDLKKQSAAANETADWLTYNDTYDKISFKYPKDWKLSEVDKTAEFKRDAPFWKGPFTFVYLTSPNGFTLSLINHGQGIGGTCRENCPQNKFYSNQKITTLSNNVDLYLVKYEQYDASGKNLNERKIGYIGSNPETNFVPDFNNYQGFPPYFLFTSVGVDKGLSGFSGPTGVSNYRPELTAEQYFSLPDLQTASKILSTVQEIK